MDHTQWLGDTLGKIAAEKAGIFLEGVPAISSPQETEAREVLEKEANEKRTPLRFIKEPQEGYGIALVGTHQKWNAALALAALHSLGLRMGYESVVEGLAKVSWPGRFERITSQGIEVVLDGAHNPHAAKVLRETWLAEMGAVKGTLIFGAMEAKDVSGILDELCGLTQRILLCKVGTTRGLPTEELVKCLPTGAHADSFANFSEAMEAARSCGSPVLVAGSLFLIGEARAALLGVKFQASAQ